MSNTKAYQHIQTLVTPIVMDQLPTQVQNGYAIGTAVGTQLDVIGKYVGVVRTGFGPAGAITLGDSDFTRLIQLAIVNNNNNGTLSSIQQFLHTYFPGEIYIFDNQNMQISYYINSTGTSLDLAFLFINQKLLPKTLGVQLAAVIYSPDILEFFGCCTYSGPPPTYENFPFVSPLNSYGSYNMDYPWLSYKDALILQT